MSEEQNTPKPTPESGQAPTQQPPPQAQAQPQQQTTPQQPQATSPQGQTPMQGQPQMQGQPSAGAIKYAGFWIRFVATIIDVLILGVCEFIVNLVTGGGGMQGDEISVESLILLIIYTAYYTAATGSSMQATIGKRVVGLRVMRSDGQPITYLRAFGRFWATILSAITLMIGYIMAGLTKQKTALHDLVADTRVVYANSIK